jgi:hypothetical protein
LQMMSIPSAPTDDSPLGTDNASLLWNHMDIWPP